MPTSVEVPTNWVQAVEASMDSSHVGVLHESTTQITAGGAHTCGVTAAGGVTALPLSDFAAWGPITIEGRTPPPGERFVNADQRTVAGHYFAALGIQGTTLSVVLGHTLFVTPYVMIVMMAALRNVDAQIEAAGMIMGASRIYVFRKVTLPMLRNALIAAGLFAFLMSFDEMIIAFFLSGFGTATLPVKMYESIVHEVSPVLSAISALLTFLALVICLAVTALSGRSGRQRSH